MGQYRASIIVSHSRLDRHVKLNNVVFGRIGTSKLFKNEVTFDVVFELIRCANELKM